MCDKLSFYCCFQIFLFFFDFCQFNYNVFWFNSFRVQPIWGLLSLMNLDVHFLPQVWKFSVIISLDRLSVPFSFSFPSRVTIMHTFILFCWYCIKPIGFLHSFFFFSFCSPDWIIFNGNWKQIFPSAFSNLLLKLSFELFSSVIAFFSSSIFIYFV